MSNSTWPECQEVSIADYETLGELMLALKTELPTPCILVADNGCARHLIDESNKSGVLQGLMLALEHRLETAE